jgi:leucyl/phenylalanyl-tRNA--protein transferase
VSLGAAFFGESMFSRERDASKVALVHLVAQLIRGGFTLLDAQFQTEHLAQFGAVAISREAYLERLTDAIGKHADLNSAATVPGAHALRQIATTGPC